MKIEYIGEKRKDDWSRFLRKNKGSFLQSFSWGRIEGRDKKVWRIAVSENNLFLIAAQLFKEILPVLEKNFFYIPFGPAFKKDLSPREKEKAFKVLIAEIKRLAEKEKAVFLRIEPVEEIPKMSGLKPALRRVQPQKTLILNLSAREEDIFESFKKRTRYSIRFAAKKHVEAVRKQEYCPEFFRLLSKTAKRKKFFVFEEDHYKKMFDNRGGEDLEFEMWLAEYKGKIAVANILAFFSKTAYYLHSASDLKYARFLNASEFLQWAQIKAAKEKGCEEYDFWGFDEKRWPGVSLFKKGFNGTERQYPQGKEIVFNGFWYFIYKTLKLCKRLLKKP